MAHVTLELPSALEVVLPGLRCIELEAATLAEALATATTKHPGLRTHLFDEQGAFRQHVLCFHNETNTRWLDSLDVPLEDGDTIRILQAVSGG